LGGFGMMENDVMELNIPDDYSIDFIKKTLNYYRENHIIIKVTFRGKSIYSHSPSLDQDIYCAYYNVTFQEYYKVKELAEKIEMLKEKREYLLKIKENNMYRFYINYAIQFVRKDKIDDFLNEMIINYSLDDGVFLLKDITTVLSIVDEMQQPCRNMNETRSKLFNFFQTKITEDDQIRLDMAIDTALNYTKYPELLRQFLYFDSLADVEQSLDDEISENVKNMNKTKD